MTTTITILTLSLAYLLITTYQAVKRLAETARAYQNQLDSTSRELLEAKRLLHAYGRTVSHLYKKEKGLQ